ncbi:MAG: ATP-binding cassette domain-containing protein [Marinoscillum sp.]
MLEFKNIRKSYNELEIIKDISGQINSGEITALIGPSGSGKSTLFRLLSLLEDADSGIINFNGYTLDFSSRKLKKPTVIWPKITLVFQQLYLWPNLTMKQNIMLPHKNIERDSIEFKTKLNDLIELFELEDYLDRYPNQLSIGQRQRIALIRGLMLKPDILLLDEITSSLDVEHIQKVKSVLKTEKESGTGFVVATHLLGFAKSVADNIWFIENGRFVEQGSIKSLDKPKTERFAEFLSLME